MKPLESGPPNFGTNRTILQIVLSSVTFGTRGPESSASKQSSAFRPLRVAGPPRPPSTSAQSSDPGLQGPPGPPPRKILRSETSTQQSRVFESFQAQTQPQTGSLDPAQTFAAINRSSCSRLSEEKQRPRATQTQSFQTQTKQPQPSPEIAPTCHRQVEASSQGTISKKSKMAVV